MTKDHTPTYIEYHGARYVLAAQPNPFARKPAPTGSDAPAKEAPAEKAPSKEPTEKVKAPSGISKGKFDRISKFYKNQISLLSELDEVIEGLEDVVGKVNQLDGLYTEVQTSHDIRKLRDFVVKLWNLATKDLAPIIGSDELPIMYRALQKVSDLKKKHLALKQKGGA